MKNHVLLIFLLIFAIGCNKAEWIKTANGVYLYGNIPNKGNMIWEGATTGPLAEGEGLLVTLNSNGSVNSKVKYNTFLGVVDSFQYITTPFGKYLGNKHNDILNGFGVLIRNDTLFIGSFNEGELCGHSQIYSNIESTPHPCYIGKMKNGIPDEIGKIYTDGLISYEGTFDSGLKEGLGHEYISGKLVYSGTFKNDYRHGKGREYIDGNLVYDGEWSKGLRHGKGLAYNSKGLLVYSGNFKDNKYHGKGLLYKEGECVEGKWLDGRLVKSISTSVFNQVSDATKALFSNLDSLNITTTPEVNKHEYPESQLQFIEQLHIEVEEYIAKEVEIRVSKRFGFWHLLRMVVQPWMISDVKRADNAENYLLKNIPADKVQNLINAKIDYYNESTDTGDLQYVNIEKIPNGSIVSNDVAIKIFEREALETSEILIGVLLDILLCFIIAFILGFIIGAFIPGLLPFVGIIDTIMLVLSIGIGIYISIFRTTVVSMELENQICEQIVNNYMQYIEIQNIVIQMIGV